MQPSAADTHGKRSNVNEPLGRASNQSGLFPNIIIILLWNFFMGLVIDKITPIPNHLNWSVQNLLQTQIPNQHNLVIIDPNKNLRQKSFAILIPASRRRCTPAKRSSSRCPCRASRKSSGWSRWTRERSRSRTPPSSQPVKCKEWIWSQCH